MYGMKPIKLLVDQFTCTIQNFERVDLFSPQYYLSFLQYYLYFDHEILICAEWPGQD
jgi:hypothetical protein